MGFPLLAGPALQPAIAAISVCQSAANWTWRTDNWHNPLFQDHALPEQLHTLPSDLPFCVDDLDQVPKQMIIMALISIHMWRIMWLKVWTAEAACKRCFTHVVFFFLKDYFFYLESLLL